MEQVIVETTLSTGQVQQLIENSGRMAILRGLGTAGTGLKLMLYNVTIITGATKT